MATLRENDAPPAEPIRENAGRLVEAAPPPASSTLAEHTASVLLESPHEVPGVPRESMVGTVTLENPATSSPTSAEPAPATATPTPAPPAVQRIVGLPARPRLRLSFAFDAKGELSCEAVLMDERRELVKRSTFDPKADPTVERCFTYFATQLVRELAASGVLVVLPSPRPAPEPEKPEEPADGAVAAALANDGPPREPEGPAAPAPADVDGPTPEAAPTPAARDVGPKTSSEAKTSRGGKTSSKTEK